MQPTYIEPVIVNKTWGKEVWMVNNEKYCGKLLIFNKDNQFSLHYHIKKDESWYILSGKLIFRWVNTNNGQFKERILSKDDAIRIPPGLPHQLFAIEKSVIVETSTQHFEEDSHRIRCNL